MYIREAANFFAGAEEVNELARRIEYEILHERKKRKKQGSPNKFVVHFSNYHEDRELIEKVIDGFGGDYKVEVTSGRFTGRRLLFTRVDKPKTAADEIADYMKKTLKEARKKQLQKQYSVHLADYRFEMQDDVEKALERFRLRGYTVEHREGRFPGRRYLFSAAAETKIAIPPTGIKASVLVELPAIVTQEGSIFVATWTGAIDCTGDGNCRNAFPPIPSQGASKNEALRNLAEAIELRLATHEDTATKR